jgi:hypothetical protein
MLLIFRDKLFALLAAATLNCFKASRRRLIGHRSQT